MTLTIEKLEKELKENNLQSIYLLYGEENFLLDLCVKKIKKIFGELVKGINYIEIDDTNLGELIQDIETPAFGFDKKLIIVKNTELFKREVKRKGASFVNLRDKINDYIKENYDVIKDTVILVFIEESVDKGKFLNTMEQIGATTCNFEEQSLATIIARLKAICKAYKVNVDDNTIRYLTEAVRT